MRGEDNKLSFSIIVRVFREQVGVSRAHRGAYYSGAS